MEEIENQGFLMQLFSRVFEETQIEIDNSTFLEDSLRLTDFDTEEDFAKAQLKIGAAFLLKGFQML